MKMFSAMSRFCLLVACSSIAFAQEHDYEAIMRAKETAYTEIRCAIIPATQNLDTDDAWHHASHPHIPAPRSVRAVGNLTTSTNWSGYAAASSFSSEKKNSVSAVYGSWIVPTLASTPNDSYCAIWVGIDGYGSSTVEQIGTEHDWINGAQQDSAWFEMYPGGSYNINGFPLNPGDEISASVVYAGSSTFVLKLYNDTQRVYSTIPTRYTRSSVAQRKCAEWIVEAPYLNVILPLSDFVSIALSACTATINGFTEPIKNSKWQNVGIEMVTNNGTPKAIPSTLSSNGQAFTVVWHHE